MKLRYLQDPAARNLRLQKVIKSHGVSFQMRSLSSAGGPFLKQERNYQTSDTSFRWDGFLLALQRNTFSFANRRTARAREEYVMPRFCPGPCRRGTCTAVSVGGLETSPCFHPEQFPSG